MQQHKIVSEQEWLAARKELLAKEKELTRARDQLSAERRALPWVKVEKTYMFDTPDGRRGTCPPEGPAPAAGPTCRRCTTMS